MKFAAVTGAPWRVHELAREPTSAGSSLPAVTIVAHDVGSVGGMERQLAELAVGLRHKGHDVTVIARKCVLPPDSGVSFHRVRGPSRPFVIAYPWFVIAGSLAVRRFGRGVIQSTGAIVLNRVDSVAVHCCHQAYTAMPGRPTLLFRSYGVAVGIFKRVAERVAVRINRRARFVCVSDGVADEMRSHFPQVADRVLTIHNGVDTAAFAPGLRREEAAEMRAQLGVAPEERLLAFVGGDWEHKRLRVAIEALTAAPHWQLAVAGRGLVGPYQELGESLGVAGRLHWLGIVHDIQLVYACADAFIMPSSYETFSLVTFEAAASGLAILATPVNGVRELITDGESGFVIGSDPGAIAQRLSELAGDDALRDRLGTAAREAALGFRWDRMVDEHSRLFGDIAQD